MYRWAGLTAVILGIINSSFAKEEVPTDFTAPYVLLEQLEKNLSENGLTILGKHTIAGNTNYTSIVYTSDDLKQLGSKENRGFVSVLRILHNAEAKQVVASNPEYYIRAFFQKDYKDGMAKPVLAALQGALGKLEPTEDALTAKKLAKYKFMVGMPKYHDFVRVAKGSNAELKKKLETKAEDRIVFKLDIKGDGSSVLYGVKLPVEIERFNEKLETMKQSHLLPYTVLIENDEANILHAKFYLAVSFPQLTMTEFMKIMSVPGDIADAFKADFK